MTASESLSALLDHQRETEALAAIAGRLEWDQETMMPPGAAEQRGEESAAISHVLHARRTDSRIGDWLAAAEGAEMTDAQAAMLRHIRRDFDRTRKVPATLAAEIARVTSVAQGRWAAARAADDFPAFAPVLARIVALRQEEGQALADGGDVYDALLDDYEPEMTATRLDAIFGEMRPRLTTLRERVLDRPEPAGLTGAFDEDRQLAFTRTLAQTFGYDLTRGRLDKSVHPFSSGSGADVRITTRVNPLDPFNCFFSTIHEVGHACYEQGIDPAYALTPLGHGVSMGVHESQSRIYENQLGRSRAFAGWMFDRMRDSFGDIGIDDADTFYAVVNRVQRDFIRTESDELQYNLHIMLRFDLERALISGDLAAADLEGAWNERFRADFGYDVPRPSLGCLQDVHWSVGLFGYFPTYSLGNVYAGCLHKALRRDIPDLDDHLARGETAPATSWLRDRVQRHGGLYRPAEVIERACGEAPTAGPLLDYIEAKFGALYDL
ncbi:thermostable carboxypeptidase [Pseudooceanicola batsensis HTCC2597]|uniref:Metal-dependent carboxypeptidase n=1 Tax=Pseudooceanicola batsensis (strain ATCC BAA-863 / DSM 15984 / KCTC 12145 / HTCC2597) TaxID=252305 RepID=A3TXH6_PSEBH|nr:carboxypeptidase M32 [Pseudooceanicola batsensis]EAQ03536.1 thermostable carboxypeptidase [Pseudooceanicola batsensis HTCC2597]